MSAQPPRMPKLSPKPKVKSMACRFGNHNNCFMRNCACTKCGHQTGIK